MVSTFQLTRSTRLTDAPKTPKTLSSEREIKREEERLRRMILIPHMNLFFFYDSLYLSVSELSVLGVLASWRFNSSGFLTLLAEHHHE